MGIKQIFVKIGALCFLGCFSIIGTKSQDLFPFEHDNYAGISGVYLQPASIADSRYKIDITIGSGSFNIYNNFFSIKKSDIFKLYKPREVLILDENDDTKYLYQNTQFQALNIMYSINRKWSAGFTARVREVANADNVSVEIANFLYNKFDATELIGMIYDQNPSFNLSAWAEYGLTAAGVVWDHEKHFIKAGLTLKLLQGISSAYMNADIHQIVVKGSDSIGTNGNPIVFNYGTSDNILQDLTFKLNSKSLNVGMDIGIIYEWRPKNDHYRYDMDGKTNLQRPDKNKYKLKAGISILDISRIKYKKGINSQDFIVKTEKMQYFNISIFDRVKDLEDFNNIIDSLLNLPVDDPNYGIFTKSNDNEYYNMILPTAISIQIDYHVWNDFYLNFSPYFALGQHNKTSSRVHALTSFALTPRYETSNIGVSVPFQYNNISKLTVGLGLRLGPVWLGSNNLFGLLFNNEIKNLNFNIALKVPVKYKLPKDTDKDLISDKLDKCVKISGILENNGCPENDMDQDGIVDLEDECPDVYGLPELNGCPDADNDGIPDHKDYCPDRFGSKENNGCPEEH